MNKILKKERKEIKHTPQPFKNIKIDLEVEEMCLVQGGKVGGGIRMKWQRSLGSGEGFLPSLSSFSFLTFSVREIVPWKKW